MALTEKQKEAKRRFEQRHPERVRSQRRQEKLKRKYGITLEDYDRLLFLQDGLCAICRKPPSGNGCNAVLHVDHCHGTGKIRGLLCGECNTGLGLFRDDPMMLDIAKAYLNA